MWKQSPESLQTVLWKLNQVWKPNTAYTSAQKLLVWSQLNDCLVLLAQGTRVMLTDGLHQKTTKSKNLYLRDEKHTCVSVYWYNMLWFTDVLLLWKPSRLNRSSRPDLEVLWVSSQPKVSVKRTNSSHKDCRSWKKNPSLVKVPLLANIVYVNKNDVKICDVLFLVFCLYCCGDRIHTIRERAGVSSHCIESPATARGVC